MFVVIFRATFHAALHEADAEYLRTAARLRELALSEFGCVEFHSLTEGRQEIALSYWTSEENIRAWKSHPEHVAAQRAGKERWYESYKVEVAQIGRCYVGSH